VFDGRLYIAYGDYTANTGPIKVSGLNLATQLGSGLETTLHTEETWTMRVIDGVLFVPYMDPQGTNADPSQGQYATRPSAGSWTAHTNVPDATHVFDIAKTADGLWLFGSIEGVAQEATIWRSTDDGATWTKALQTGDNSGFSRFYAVWQTVDTMLAFLSSTTDAVWRWNSGDTEWADVTADFDIPVLPTEGFAFAYQDGPTLVPYFVGQLQRKEAGVVGAWAAMPVLLPEDTAHEAAVLEALPDSNTTYLDACTDPGTGDQYLLAGGLSAPGVWRSVIHGAFEMVIDLDDPANANVRCMTVGGDGYLYFGTSDSRILRTPIPA
jgi:hypothetical protein